MHNECWVIDEVVQVTEPAPRIFGRPLVQIWSPSSFLTALGSVTALTSGFTRRTCALSMCGLRRSLTLRSQDMLDRVG